jgi:YVTN family beta-propeller protein
MTWALGVDLGTTYSAASAADGRNVFPLALGAHGSAVPSAIYAGEHGMAFGEPALALGSTHPERLLVEFKRALGESDPILAGDKFVGAEELVGALGRWVYDRACELEGGPPERAVFTVPAFWGGFRRDQFLGAVRLIVPDQERVAIMSEPEAAAAYYATKDRLDPGAVVGVYDLGGGTFDASILRMTDDGFELLGRPTGDAELGGIDLDRALFDHVMQLAGIDWNEIDRADPQVARGLAQLRQSVVLCKELLSVELNADIGIALPSVVTTVRITRREFERLAEPVVERTIAVFERALSFASLRPADLHSILLVGGGSRMPLVGEALSQKFGAALAVDSHPKFAVCLGAAITAAGSTRAGRDGSTGQQSWAAPRPEDASAAPTILGPVPVVAPPGLEPTAEQRRQRAKRRGRLVLALGLAAAAIVIVAIIAFVRGGKGGGASGETVPTTAAPATVRTATPPTTGAGTGPLAASKQGSIAVGDQPLGINYGFGSVWVAQAGEQSIVRIDPATGNTVPITVGNVPTQVAVGADGIWVSVGKDNKVVRIDPSTNKVVASITVGNKPWGIAAAASGIWVANEQDNTVNRIDPATNAVAQTFAVPPLPDWVFADDSGVWVGSIAQPASMLSRIAPASGQVTSVPVDPRPLGIVGAFGSIWVTGPDSDTLTRFDPATMAQQKKIKLGTSLTPVGVTATSRGIWVANASGNNVMFVDPSADAVTDTVAVGREPFYLAPGNGTLWVADHGEDAVSKVGPA